MPINYDWKHPDYPAVFAARLRGLEYLRKNPKQIDALRAYYRDAPWAFISDWGCTSDPRNVEVGRPVIVPFVLYPRQIEWCQWVVERWRNREPGVTPKSRELGLSWLAIALSCTLCLFNDSVAIGFGSRKAELVDKLGDPDSLFWKAREFMQLVPREFKGAWTLRDAPEMRIKFPLTGSVIKGEGGDDIGRGGRSSIYFVDEAAFLARPGLAESSLSQTTNCRIDVSTANGLGNPFHRKVTTWPPERVFRFHWRDDPRKDDAWYAKQVDELDPVTVAQEVDIDFAASVEGVLIPSAWVQAAIDSHVRLGIEPSGEIRGALDVADEGRDMNAFAVGHGIRLAYIEEWTGKGDDIFGTVQKAFMLADAHGALGFDYDADGLGAGVRGDARVVNDQRRAIGLRDQVPPILLDVAPFRGSGEVLDPDAEDVKGRKNKDFFQNRKAQAWWALRRRFQETYRAVVEGTEYDPAEIISLPAPAAGAPQYAKLIGELSQPTYSINTIGKIVIDKAPEGTRSPNLADAVMIRFGRPKRATMAINPAAIRALGARRR